MIAQQYLPAPLLVDGYKFDMRLYVLVLSCSPLRVLLFKEGLARFCTERYRAPTESNMDDTYMHLTKCVPTTLPHGVLHSALSAAQHARVDDPPHSLPPSFDTCASPPIRCVPPSMRCIGAHPRARRDNCAVLRSTNITRNSPSTRAATAVTSAPSRRSWRG